MKNLLLPIAAAVATMDSFAQEKLTLPYLEGLIMGSPAVRIANTEREAAEARHVMTISDLSPKLFISGTVASSKDPVRPERYDIETTTAGGTINRSQTVLTAAQDRYTRYGAVIGVRIPLFGSRDVLVKNVEVAESNIAVARARETVAYMEALKGLRYAYVEHYYRKAQGKLARAYAQAEGDIIKILDSRKNAKLILNAEFKELRGGFHTANNDASSALAAADESAAKIRILTGLAVDNVEFQPPLLPIECRPYAEGSESGEVHPALRLHASALEEKRRVLANTGRSLPESGVTISQGLNRFEDGRTGNSTAVSFDVQFPLGGPSGFEAAKKLALAEVSKAEIEYDQQKVQYLSTVENVKREVGMRQQHIGLLEDRLDTAKEAERVARLRVSQPEGDAVERLVRSRQAMYQAYHSQLEAELLLAKARIDMMGLEKCEGSKEARTNILEQAIPQLTQALLPPNTMNFQTASLRNVKDSTNATQENSVPVLGWYAWHTLKRFEPAKANAFWSKLPKTSRVLLSLNASQIEGVTSRQSEIKRLDAFLASAKKRNIEVGLLLGDPGWIQPGENEKLIGIVQSLKRFPFTSIHLDIEESQVPADKKSAWAPGLVSLVKELRSKTSMPIAVSLHPRDVAVQYLLPGLKEAGATEIALMQYSTNQEKVADNLANVMRSHPDLRFSLAQSIEPILSNEESYAKKPKKAVVATLQKISMRLQAEPNFAGVIVQSLDDYLNGALHED